MTNQKSSCCNSEIKFDGDFIINGVYLTSWKCLKCRQPCDLIPATPQLSEIVCNGKCGHTGCPNCGCHSKDNLLPSFTATPREERCNGDCIRFAIECPEHNPKISPAPEELKENWEDIAQKIIDRFFEKGAKVSKADYDYVKSQIQKAEERVKREYAKKGADAVEYVVKAERKRILAEVEKIMDFPKTIPEAKYGITWSYKSEWRERVKKLKALLTEK